MQALTKPGNIEDLIPMVTRAVGVASTKKDYARELRSFFRWYAAVDILHPEGFARSTVMAYREAMVDAKRGPVSINKALCAIRRLAREAADNGYLAEVTAVRIEGVPQVERHASRLGNWLTLEQMRQLLTSAPVTTPNRAMRDRTAMWILGTCGLRREEAAALRLGQLQERAGRWVFVDVLGKGNKLRSIPVHPLAAEAIHNWCRFADITEPDERILTTVLNPDRLTKLPITGARIYDAAKRYCRALNQSWAPHDLRRSFSVLAEEGGAPLREISEALGHASVTTTELYLKGPRSMKNAAADKIKI